ncbi:MAG: tetratricopeptide repeat protein [Vibrio sp.]
MIRSFACSVTLLLSCGLLAFSVSAAGLMPYTVSKLGQASQFAQKDNLAKAIDVLKGVNTNKAYDKAFVNRVLGIYYWQAEQPQNSIKVLRQAVSAKVLEPQTQWEANRMLGDVLYSQQQFSDATTEYRNALAVKYSPSSKDKAQYQKDVNDVHFRIAAAYYQNQQWQQVRSALLQYHASDAEKRLQALQMQAIAELRLSQWHNAESTLAQLIRIEPNNNMWWQQLISAQLQQQHNQDALNTYALAKKQNLEFTDSDYKTLSQLYANNGIPERGARILDEMFAAFPKTKTEENLKTQAYYYQMGRDWKKAISSWEGLAQRNAEYNWQLTQLYLQQKQYAKAEQVIDKAQPYAKKSDYSLAKINLLYRLEKYDDALAEAKRLNETMPSDSAHTWIVFLQNKMLKDNAAENSEVENEEASS